MRLIIATCLAYIWLIYLGVLANEEGSIRIIHRSDRCDLGTVQLGLSLLPHKPTRSPWTFYDSMGALVKVSGCKSVDKHFLPAKGNLV